MAHTKSGGSTNLGRDSQSQRLGVKMFNGQPVKPGMIIVRQRGSSFRPGRNVRRGGDDTLFAIRAGIVKIVRKTAVLYDGKRAIRRYVHVDA